MTPLIVSACLSPQLAVDPVARITADATLLEVADALAASDVGAHVAGDGNAVDGIVSESGDEGDPALPTPSPTTRQLPIRWSGPDKAGQRKCRGSRREPLGRS